MMRAIIISLILFFSSPLFAGLNWAVSSKEMQRYVRQCGERELPSVRQMERSLRDSITAQNIKAEKSILGRLSRSFNNLFSSQPEIKEINIDGFKVKKLSPAELSLLLRMTAHSDFYGELLSDDYEETREVKNGTLYINRKCKSELCETRESEKLSYIFNLDTVPNQGSLCEDIICASKRIFGDPKGVYLAYALNKYGLQLSRYSHPNADPGGFKLDTLKAVITAAKSTPEHLHERALKDTTFYRFIKGGAFSIYGFSDVIAIASGAIFDEYQ